MATDLYSRSPAFRGIFWTLFALWVVGFVGACIGGILSISVRHDAFADPAEPGKIVSDRYTSYTWVILLLFGLKIFIPLIVALVVIARYNKGCIIVIYVFYVIFFAMSCMIFFHFLELYSNCNKPGQGGNICNDSDYCCDEENRLNPVNKCPNFDTGPCDVPNPPLTGRVPFNLLYWFNFGIFMIEIIWIFLLGLLWITSIALLPSSTKEANAETEEDDEEEDIPDEKSIVAQNTNYIEMTRTIAQKRNSPFKLKSKN